MSNRISFFESQLGSIIKVEEYFRRSIESMKDELSLIVKEQFYSQKKQSSIINDVKISLISNKKIENFKIKLTISILLIPKFQKINNSLLSSYLIVT